MDILFFISKNGLTFFVQKCILLSDKNLYRPIIWLGVSTVVTVNFPHYKFLCHSFFIWNGAK